MLEAGGAQLTADGYSARSAFLTSPTFGGVSWLAHATLQSGVWVDSQQKYDRLTAGDRFTLARAFEEAGWRTVAVVPSNHEPWPLGTSFYGWDAMLHAENMGYRGPAFSYARIPDQYTWQHFHERELAGAARPGDGRDRPGVVAHAVDAAPSPRPVVGGRRRQGVPPAARRGPLPGGGVGRPGARPDGLWTVGGVHPRTMFSFLHTYDQPNLVLVVLGDHQPARIVSGPAADRDVPVTVISKDPAVFDAIASWGWDAGVHPSPDAPVWRMDVFRDRFLEAFGR